MLKSRPISEANAAYGRDKGPGLSQKQMLKSWPVSEQKCQVYGSGRSRESPGLKPSSVGQDIAGTKVPAYLRSECSIWAGQRSWPISEANAESWPVSEQKCQVYGSGRSRESPGLKPGSVGPRVAGTKVPAYLRSECSAWAGQRSRPISEANAAHGQDKGPGLSQKPMRRMGGTKVPAYLRSKGHSAVARFVCGATRGGRRRLARLRLRGAG
jgi:hypothetical protein